MLKQILFPLISDPQSNTFKIVIDKDNVFIIDVRHLKLEHVGVFVDTRQDWKLFIDFIDHQLKNVHKVI